MLYFNYCRIISKLLVSIVIGILYIRNMWYYIKIIFAKNLYKIENIT